MATRSTSPAYPRKMFFKGYAGQPAYLFEHYLNIRVEGGESFQIPGKTRTTRTASMQCLEGLGACLSGYVEKVYFDQGAGTTLCAINADAFRHSHVMKTASSITSQGGYFAGTDGSSVIYSSFPSTSPSASNQAPGKCEISIFPVMLLDAARKYESGNMAAKQFLERYQELLRLLASSNAVPIVNNASPISNASAVKELILKTADACYEWIAYGGPVERQGAPAKMADWDWLEMTTVTTIPTERPAVAKMLTDSSLFDDFMSGGQLPTILSNNVAAASASGPVNPAPATNNQPVQQAQPVQPKAQAQRGGSAAAPAPINTNLDSKLKSVRDGYAELYLKGLLDGKFLRMPKGGCPAVLLQGPAGTGKTTAIRIISELDKMPTTRISCSSETDISLLLGSYQKDNKGFWQANLGVLAKVVRSAMLEALFAALEKGGSTGSMDPGKPICRLIVKYARTATKPIKSATARKRFLSFIRQKIDSAATPIKPDVWEWVEEAYFASGAAEVGCTRRVFLDEIHDAVTNKPLSHLLKVLLEDERCLLLSTSDIGGMNLYAYNVQFIGAGNPKPGYSFEQAVTSRFALTFSVGYSTQTEVIKRITANSRKSWAVQRPVSINVTNEGFVPEPVRTFEVTARMAEAAEKLGIWTRNEFKLGNMGGLLDPRGAEFLASHATFLKEVIGMSVQDAFLEAANMQFDRIAELDDLGLPVQSQTEKLKQQAKQFAMGL